MQLPYVEHVNSLEVPVLLYSQCFLSSFSEGVTRWRLSQHIKLQAVQAEGLECHARFPAHAGHSGQHETVRNLRHSWPESAVVNWKGS